MSLALTLLVVLDAVKAQETSSRHFLRGMRSNLEDKFPVRRLQGSGPASAPARAGNVELPVLSKDELHVMGYDLFTRQVTVAWDTTVQGLTWELQVQRWNRYGDEVLASWVAVGGSPESKAMSLKQNDTQMREVFVDLQRYLYTFRVRAISINGTEGAFSSITDLYGEPVDKNTTVPKGTSTLQASELYSEPEVPEALKLGSGFPLKQHGDQTFIVLKTVKVSLELDVQPGFATFYRWAHDALPILRRSISEYLSPSASVSIKSAELFLNSTSCNYNSAECNVRKYVALSVSAIIMSGNSGAEYDSEVDRVRIALESLRDTKFLHLFVSELVELHVSVPDGLALTQSTDVIVEEIELSVASVEADPNSDCAGSCSESNSNLYFFVGGGVIALISGLVIGFLFKKYRRLSQVARELNEKKEQHAHVISDLEKQASEIRHEMEEVQHAREAIQHEREQASSMCPAISVQKVEQLDPKAIDWIEKLDPKAIDVEVLPTLLATAAASKGNKDGKR